MSQQFQPLFKRLRGILENHASGFAVARNEADHYALEAPVGPATIRAWGGKVKKPTIPVAWVQIGKSYVSFHLMGVYGIPHLLEGCSPELRARMQGQILFQLQGDGRSPIQGA